MIKHLYREQVTLEFAVTSDHYYKVRRTHDSGCHYNMSKHANFDSQARSFYDVFVFTNNTGTKT